jgi:pimeloyl-[acyl-carrier protein] synthase
VPAIETQDDLASAVASFMTLQSAGRRYVDDPYPLFDRLLAETSAYQTSLGPWLVTRHADIDRLARRDLLGREAVAQRFQGLSEDSPMVALTAAALNFRNPPDHTRLRGLVSKGFTPRGVKAWRPMITELVDDLIAGLAGRDEIDVLHDFAIAVPMRVICQLLGIPMEFHEGSMRYVDALVQMLEPGPKPPELWQEADAIAAQTYDQLAGYVRARSRDLGDDVLSGLITASEGDDRLTEDEVIGQVLNLHIAGYETTSNLITNAVLTLLRHPDQLALLQADPGLINGAIEEALRYESPARTVLASTAERDIEFEDGSRIPGGDSVILVVAAANRDPAVFDDPGHFDIRRSPNLHVAFSSGYHFCLGAHLARLESQIALGALIERFPRMRLASDEVQWRQSWTLRALARLPVRL